MRKNIFKSAAASQGSAFLLALVFLFISLSGITVFHSHIRTMLKISENETFLDNSASVIHVGMAKGLNLMETGTPVDTYTCKPAALNVALIYKLKEPTVWNISASTAAYDIAEATCTCPANFADTGRLWSTCQS